LKDEGEVILLEQMLGFKLGERGKIKLWV